MVLQVWSSAPENITMDDTRLIVEVEKLSIIYDPRNILYKDSQAKEKAWEEVAVALGADGKFLIFFDKFK